MRRFFAENPGPKFFAEKFCTRPGRRPLAERVAGGSAPAAIRRLTRNIFRINEGMSHA